MAGRPRKATAPKVVVDETVVNQENPGTSEEERPATDNLENTEVAKMAPAMEVDETVVNQENPGTSAVDRNPEPQLVTKENGVTYDISKSAPEVVVDSREAEKNRIRQTESVLDARTDKEPNDEFFTIEFVDSGLTYAQRVWKKGQTVDVPKNRKKAWMDLSNDEQVARWGKVKFEKR